MGTCPPTQGHLWGAPGPALPRRLRWMGLRGILRPQAPCCLSFPGRKVGVGYQALPPRTVWHRKEQSRWMSAETHLLAKGLQK